MRRQRNIKIVATLGPSSSDYHTIKELHLAGADVFRLNMSHGTHDEIAKSHKIIRQIEGELNSPIAILADLQGPKLRVGPFKNGVEELTENEKFRLDLKDELGTKDRVQLPHPEIFQALHEGAHLLINDGKIKLMVEKCGSDFADCLIVNSGEISDRKGVNVPDVILPLAALSEKDLADLMPTVPDGAHIAELSEFTVTLYWDEKGDTEAVDCVADALRSLIHYRGFE